VDASENQRPRILIIAHAINMDGRAASLTVTDKIPFFLTRGIEITVVSAALGSQSSQYQHIRVWPLGPSGLRFDFRHWLKTKCETRLMQRLLSAFLTTALAPFVAIEKTLTGLQNSASWSVSAFIASLIVVIKTRPDLIYTSGGAYSAHYAGLWLKRLTGIPLICEIHDPLVKPEAIRLTRDLLAQRHLEGELTKIADYIWWFTQGAYESACLRHPALRTNGGVIIPGAAPAIDKAKKRSTANGVSLRIGHFGSLADDRSLVQFLKVLQAMRNSGSMGCDIDLYVYGAPLDRASREYLHEYPNPFVHLVGRIEADKEKSGREKILDIMSSMSVLLIIHGESIAAREYIPSKFYDYLYAGPPILAITFQNEQFTSMLLERGAYIARPEGLSIQYPLENLVSDNLSGCLGINWKSSPISAETAVQKILTECRQRNLLQWS